jgi:hypothetical protein
MVRTLINFIYIARCDIIDSNSLKQLDNALECFHQYRQIFQESGVCPKGFNLPRQHSLVHYYKLIRAFGALNRLCFSITESKHIKAVKESWQRSNLFEALSQMLLTNQWLDKLAASHVNFTSRGLLQGTFLSSILEELCILLPWSLLKNTNTSPFQKLMVLTSKMSRSSSPNTMTTTTLAPLNMTMMPTPAKMKTIGVMPLSDQQSLLMLTWQRRVVSKLSSYCTCVLTYVHIQESRFTPTQSQRLSISQTWSILSSSFYTTSATLTQSQINHLVTLWTFLNFMKRFMFSLLPLLHFTPKATSLGFVACDMSTFMLLPHGERVLHAMTVSSQTRTHPPEECVASTSPVYAFYLLSNTKGLHICAPLYTGICAWVTPQMRIRGCG